MEKFVIKPFRPYITLEQMQAFDPQNPDTFTPSPEVNAILAALHRLGPGCGTKLNRYLRLDTTTLRCILKTATGMNLVDVRKALALRMVEKLKAENPKIKMPEVARRLGYDHRSSIWWLENGLRQSRKRTERRHELEREWELKKQIEEERRRQARQTLPPEFAEVAD